MYNEIFNKEKMIALQNYLRKNNQTITTAESCTGGLISSMITEISGSSSIFNGSIVTYSNHIKEQELKVKKETMIKFGVVSCEVVEEMLQGALNKFHADYAIAVSGIAGPNGGSEQKPVGTVAIGVMSKNGVKKIDIFHFKGERKEVQIQTAKTALKINFEILLQNS
ncbi:nicotinamide-nucleotide amidase [Arcobacter sp. 15-2]|uniref:CinA family protein n=1 Tax=Arcobacter sp. 15-2 TaxID=3374109 RepID=UPI00399D4C68